MSQYSDDEARSILEREELLNNDATRSNAATEIAEPELTREQILQEASARPMETRNQRDRREIEERNALWAAERALRETAKAETMANLEARLDARYRRLIDDQRKFIFEVVGEALGAYEKKVIELQASIDGLRAQITVKAGLNFTDPVDLPPFPMRRAVQ